jgi:multiple sugar transport system permease protein
VVTVTTTKRKGAAGRREARSGVAFSLPYAVLLVAFGFAPCAYAIYESFTDLGQGSVGPGGAGGVGLANYAAVFADFRFLPALGHVLEFMAIWIPVMVGGALFFALLLQERVGRFSSTMRLIYFLPGAVTGSAAVLLWYFMLQPGVSPFSSQLEALGWNSTNDVFAASNLPWIFALIAFMTGVGNWIVIMFGAMQSIPHEMIEAARVDGAGPIRTALSIKLPLVSKYIVYMTILCFAAALQIFVEPQLFFSITQAGSSWWSLNQLGYTFAFQQGEFGMAATVAVVLMLLSGLVAVLFVLRSNFFDTEVDS